MDEDCIPRLLEVLRRLRSVRYGSLPGKRLIAAPHAAPAAAGSSKGRESSRSASTYAAAPDTLPPCCPEILGRLPEERNGQGADVLLPATAIMRWACIRI